MVKRIVLFSLFAALMACSGGKTDNKQVEQQVDDSIAIIDVNLDSLPGLANRYVNRVVRFTGAVEHVCVHTGQRLTIAGAKGARFAVLASESVPQFEPNLKGARVEIVGVIKSAANKVAICEAEAEHHPGETYYIDCQTIKVE